jgi:Fe-S-cluster-containing hydrogenase component 2
MIDKLPNRGHAGILSPERVKQIPGYPGDERIEQGPVVVIECDEDIPCNPCEDICPRKAISVGNPITKLPRVDPDRCDGCIVCISICPGLCMFVVHKNYSEMEALIYMPYEMHPLPVKGEEVWGCDRSGEPVCRVRVEKVVEAKKLQKTAIVGVAVPREHFETVRAIKP